MVLLILLCLFVTSIINVSGGLVNGTCFSWTGFSISVSTGPGQSGCYEVTNDKYSCNRLQEALELLDELPQEDCVRIELHNERHLITSPITTRASVHISSINDKNKTTTISCDFNAERFYFQTGGLHTLYFNGSNSVIFSDIQFEACPLPIRVERSDVVLVERSSFRYFSEAVFDIHNSIQVTVHNCCFINNYGSGIINEPYRGNTGALSITYNYMDTSASNPFVTVSNSSFINNSAIPSGNFLTSDQTFASGVLTGRGGGMAVFVREDNFNVTARILGCYFTQNLVRSYGGGMYILFNGGGSHATYIEENIYESNEAMVGGAGLTLVGVERAERDPHLFIVKQCTFSSNFAAVGGGIYYSINLGGGTTNVIHIEDSCFLRNVLSSKSESFGAALAIDIAEDFSGKESFHINTLKDCLFAANVGKNSVVSIGFQTFKLCGFNQFINNTGPALRIVGATIILSDRIEFMNNYALEGAAMLLLSFSQILLADDLQLLFQNNTGRFGSSLFVSGVPTIDTFERLLHNPQCFLVLESDAQLPPPQWNQTGINITFTKNSAWFGAAVYATSLTSCSWVRNNIYNSFNLSYYPNWPIFDIRGDNFNAALSEPYNQIHSVVTDSVNLNIFNSLEVKGWPGQVLNLSLQAIDELGNPTGSLARLFFSSNQLSNKVIQVEVEPNTLLISNENVFANLTYNVDQYGGNLTAVVGGDITINHVGVFLSIEESESESIALVGENCIGGYLLRAKGDVIERFFCECDQEDENIVLCEENQDSIIIQDGQWAVQSNAAQSGSLFYYLCPLGYCRCFLNTSLGSDSCVNVYTNSDPDRQCVCGRKGVLCGECRDESGVTVLLNICTSCGRGNISLIPLLIIIIIIVMLIIVLLDKPLPQWSYPLLFYVQIAPLVSLHFPLTFNTSGKYLIYIASGLSFYFPYDFCIHTGMTALESYSLKFIPGITALVVIPVAVLMRYILSKCSSSMTLRSFNGHGIWTITLLVYTHIMYTSTSILRCPVIPHINGTSYLRWYVDGSVKCFHGGHVPLSLFAIIWIILLILLIPATVSLQHRRFKKHTVLKQLGASLKVSFQSFSGVWYGVDLFRRLFIVILVTVSPNGSIYVLLFIMLLIALYGYCLPYKKPLVNIQEILSLISFSVLLLIRANLFLQDVFEITPDSNRTSIPSCNGDESIVTTFALALSFLYYIPVVFGTVAFWIWIVITMKQYYWKFQESRKVKRSAHGATDMSDFADYQLAHESRNVLKVRTTELTIPLL